MTEYIKREAFMKRFCERCNEEMSESPCEPSDCFAREVIKTFPAADVAPVRHGEWEIVVGSNGNEYMVCTCCRVSQDLTGVFTYCPNCGAMMDGGAGNEC